MKIASIQLANFRSVQSLQLDFRHQTTALVGINGSGKSSLLDALAIGLSAFSSRITGHPGKTRSITHSDIRVGADHAAIDLDVMWPDQSHTPWRLVRQRKPGTIPDAGSHLSALNQRVTGMNQSPTLPLVVYYDIHRAVLDVPLRIREKPQFRPNEAFLDAVGRGGADFRRFFAWFRSKEDEENEERANNPSFRDRDLQAVRQAITAFTGFTKPRVRRKTGLRMTVCKDTTELDILQLSDGEKCMLALVGDLARRLCLLNAAELDPLHGLGVVLIDEIDLHLHPGWQRSVVGQLTHTFPNCQFIISTHSPQVLGELPADAIVLLKQGRYLGPPERALGLDAAAIIEELMDAPARNPGVAHALHVIDHAIEDDDLTTAQTSLDVLRQQVGDLPETIRAQAAIDTLHSLSTTD